MECYCYLRNVQDLLSDGTTPYERRFGEPLKGPVNPYGSMIEYLSLVSARDQSKDLQCGRIWRDVLVANIEELENLDASEIHARRLNPKVVRRKYGEHLRFPIADGSVECYG